MFPRMEATKRAELERELESFDPALPIEAARTPPASWYDSADLATLERRALFRRRWMAVGRAEQVAGPGRYFAGRLCDDAYVVLRDERGELRALHNVCRHHGAELCSGEGRVRALVCPYHAWSYDLRGELLRAPGLPEASFAAHGRPRLPAIRVSEHAPLVFLDLGGSADPLAELLAPFARLCPPEELAALRFVARRVFRVECNWKVYVENYLDGGYHVGHLHRELASELDLASYRTQVHGPLALQVCEARGPGSERIGAGAVYAWLHPNLMLNRYGPVLDTNIVLPLGPSACEVVFDYWLEPAAAADPAFVEGCLAASERVQREDEAICESVQRGMRSPSYGRGLYAPRVEGAMHHFHRLLAADLLAELRAD